VQDAHALCAGCWRDTTFAASPLCDRCGAPTPGTGDAAVCDACLHVPLAFARARAATIYEGAGRRIAMALKHSDRLDLARPAATWMRRAAWPLIEDADIVAPVPLHWRRFVHRRFNQSAELSRALHTLVLAEGPSPAPALIPDLLRRTRATPSQGRRTRAQRAENMRGAFAVSPRFAARIQGRRVLLVDDVFTTGATLSACAEALIAGGAGAVDAVCLARVAPRAPGPISGGTSGKDPK
jgi:predicted amidophosphoribosyltransferase